VELVAAVVDPVALESGQQLAAPQRERRLGLAELERALELGDVGPNLCGARED
jgi:hypothetical protein